MTRHEPGAAFRKGGRPFLLGCVALLVVALSPGSTALAACKVARIAELPVDMAGTRPIVAVRINGKDARFIADSGAFYSMISPETAATLHLAVTPTNAEVQGVGGIANVGIATAKTFTLAGIDIRQVIFMVGGSTPGASGLLGQNVLGFADVEYDLADGMIRLFDAQGCAGTSLAYWAGDKPYSTLSIDTPNPADHSTRGVVEVNGVRLSAVFDTGASTSIIDLAAAARAGIRPGDADVVPVGTQYGMGSGVGQIWRARFASFKVGDNEEVRNGAVTIGRIGLPGIEMLVGADFFLSHRVYVANRQRKLYFTYNGGPVFATAGGPSPGTTKGVDNRNAPADADGFARRGEARAARRDLTGALADLDEAVRRAPDRADLLLARARVRAAAQRTQEARTDVDHAVAIAPKDPAARIFRATLEIRARDLDAARADLDAAAAVLSPQDDMRRTIAGLYVDADAPDRAIPQFDRWIAAHGVDGGLSGALNGRCWARALAGVDLDKALSDCDAALRRRSGAADVLDSRGLVHLRRGELDKARADYDAALVGDPHLAWSLFGRSLVERRTGENAKADTDRAAALAIEPDLAARAHRFGIAD